MEQATQTATSTLPTRWGTFAIHHYVNATGEEAVALVHGEPNDRVLCRVHSECITGEAFGSLRCDCREQLDHAFAAIAEAGAGVIVYMRQEGRGIGLSNKIRAYALQDQGRDTLDANLELGFGADERGYDLAAWVLKTLGISRVKLLTNNPDKIKTLIQAGLDVERHPHWVSDSLESQGYIKTKQQRMGHLSAAELSTP